MKPTPVPNVPGNTEAERMDNAIRKILSVSKDDLVKQEDKWKREQVRKRRARESD